MRRPAIVAGSFALLLAVVGGCQTPYSIQAQQNQQKFIAMQADKATLQARITELDAENQRANQLLAQAEQQTQIYQDESGAYREQLRAATAQLDRMKTSVADTEQRAEALTASARRRGGAMITSNNSLKSNLPEINFPGAHVRREGDTVRVELPADALFAPQDTRLKPGAGRLLEGVAASLLRAYPDHKISVEGHAAGGSASLASGDQSHRVTVAQALAVFDHLAGRTALAAGQLRVVGHGGSDPLFSNASEAGRQRNRRIELVIHPETVGPRR